MRVGGGTAGVAGALVAAAIMVAGRSVGHTGRIPPRKIAERIFDGLHLRRSRRFDKLAGVVGHLSYSGALGKLYERSFRGKVMPNPPVAEGMLFSITAWAGSYFGWVPRLGLMPRPTRDRPDRSLTTFAANVVFGAVLGKLAHLRDGR